MRCMRLNCLWLAYGQDHEKIVLDYRTDVNKIILVIFMFYTLPQFLSNYVAGFQLWLKSLLLFSLMLYVPVNSYGHVGVVSSPNHTFSWASLTKRLTST